MILTDPPPAPPASGRGESDAKTPLPLAGGVGGGPLDNPKRGQFKPRNTARAKELRNNASPAERLLWTKLSNRKLNGFKFCRQLQVGSYYPDFLCRELRLIVELDGFSHEMRQDHDQRRDRYLAEQGYAMLRFTNAEVLGNPDGVVMAIASALAERCPPPTPPASGRGAGSTTQSTFPETQASGAQREGLKEVEAQKLLGISLEGSVG